MFALIFFSSGTKDIKVSYGPYYSRLDAVIDQKRISYNHIGLTPVVVKCSNYQNLQLSSPKDCTIETCKMQFWTHNIIYGFLKSGGLVSLPKQNLQLFHNATYVKIDNEFLLRDCYRTYCIPGENPNNIYQSPKESKNNQTILNAIALFNEKVEAKRLADIELWRLAREAREVTKQVMFCYYFVVDQSYNVQIADPQLEPKSLVAYTSDLQKFEGIYVEFIGNQGRKKSRVRIYSLLEYPYQEARNIAQRFVYKK
jgi:hypothetical protein